MKNKTSHNTYAVVGAGIMGRLVAFALHQAGFAVQIYDQKNGMDNCSFAAAGLLTPTAELDKSPLLINRLGQDSLQHEWPKILKQLDHNVYFKQLGSLVVHHPHDEAEWRHFSQRMPIDERVQILDQQALLNLEPELNKFTQAYYFPEEGQIDCQQLLSQLETYFQVQKIPCHVNTVVTSFNHLKADYVIDCRGLGAKTLFKDLRPLRGELIWLHAPEVNLQRPVRLLHPRYSLYIVPRPDHIYLIGASEIEAEDYSEISVRTTLELLTAAYYIHPGFAEARIIKTVTQCRPTLGNHLPEIQHTDGYIAINGLYRHGYLIAPALAAEVIRFIQHQPLSYPEIWKKLNV